MKRLAIAVCCVLAVGLVNAAGTVVKIPSKFSAQETTERYLNALHDAEVPVLNRKPIPMVQGEEIEFSNPFFGTIIGRCDRGARKDKPVTAKIWQDMQGKVWLSYVKPVAMINEFGVIECGHETDNVQRALDGFASSATK